VGLLLDDATKGQQRVAVISGGGSGHEPMHAGFIGSGMLDAACPGLLFTSPNAVQIGAATEWADRGKGVVHVVKNYTGDVMNFTVSANHAGVEVAQVAQRTANQSRSMAVALQPGHSPTSDRATFDLADGQIEIGVGIHGEPGVERRDIAGAQLTAAALVEELLDGILGSLGNPSGDVMLFVNGLGGTSQLEQDLIFGEALTQLTDRGLKVRRGMRGTLVTSLNMAGISLTLTVLDDELIELTDASTAAPAWPGTVNDPEYAEAILVDNETQPDSGEEDAWLTRFVERLATSYDDLTALDREAGDGDFGQNMEAGFGDVVTPVRGTDADVLNFFAHRMLVRGDVAVR